MIGLTIRLPVRNVSNRQKDIPEMEKFLKWQGEGEMAYIGNCISFKLGYNYPMTTDLTEGIAHIGTPCFNLRNGWEWNASDISPKRLAHIGNPCMDFSFDFDISEVRYE